MYLQVFQRDPDTGLLILVSSVADWLACEDMEPIMAVVLPKAA